MFLTNFMIKKFRLGHLLSISALIIAIIALIRDCYQDKRIDESEYLSKAMEFRPRLEVVSSPEITFFQLSGKSALPDSAQEIVDIPCTLTIHAKLNVVNVGNSIAKVYAVVWGDTLSGSTEIRDVLLDKKNREHLITILPYFHYFETREIQPGDTTYFKISHVVKFFKENKFTMHFLFLYANETGALYDTYYWVRYTTSPILVPLKPELKFDKTQFAEFLKLSDKNTSSKTYSKIEADDILSFLEKWDKEL